MIDRVKVVVDPKFETMFPAKKPAVAVIRTRQDRIFEAEVENPRGDYRNPFSDEALLEKFYSLTDDRVPRGRADRIVESIMEPEIV